MIRKPKVIKPQQQTTNEQRRQAVALIRSLRPCEQTNTRRMELKLGDTHYEIVIDNKKALA